MSLVLNWKKDQNNRWGNLLTSHPGPAKAENHEGVFIVWHGGISPEIVCVGKGKIEEKLKTLSESAEIKAFQPLPIYFTWAAVTAESQDGVEIFLSQKLRPKMASQATSTAEPISVNMPWRK